MLVITVVLSIGTALLLFFEDIANFVGTLFVLPVLNALIDLGMQIAGFSDGILGPGSQLLFFLGNLVLGALVLTSVSLHQLTGGKPRLQHLMIALTVFCAGLAILVVQGGFSMGFPEYSISEDLKGVSKLLMGGEGLIISYAPFYIAWKSRPKWPPAIRDEDVG